jgi:hypothetical protein
LYKNVKKKSKKKKKMCVEESNKKKRQLSLGVFLRSVCKTESRFKN